MREPTQADKDLIRREMLDELAYESRKQHIFESDYDYAYDVLSKEYNIEESVANIRLFVEEMKKYSHEVDFCQVFDNIF